MNTNESSPFALDGLIQLVRASIHFFPLFLCLLFSQALSLSVLLLLPLLRWAAFSPFSPQPQMTDFIFSKTKNPKKIKCMCLLCVSYL